MDSLLMKSICLRERMCDISIFVLGICLNILSLLIMSGKILFQNFFPTWLFTQGHCKLNDLDRCHIQPDGRFFSTPNEYTAGYSPVFVFCKQVVDITEG